MKKKMQTISIRLHEEQYERLRLLSFETRVPMAVFIREAINQYLEKGE